MECRYFRRHSQDGYPGDRGHLPHLYEESMRLKPAVGTDGFNKVLKEVYERSKPFPLITASMERTRSPVFVVPSECGWSDVGSWQSLYEMREADHDEKGNLKEGECLLVDCKGKLSFRPGGPLVACLGLKNLLVIDTRDALLVAHPGPGSGGAHGDRSAEEERKGGTAVNPTSFQRI